MARILRGFAGLTSALLLVACGGGSGESAAPPPAAPARGTLLQNPPTLLASYSVSELLAQLAASDVAKLL